MEKGKKTWIIGASSGLGKALAVELASRGSLVAVSARREGELIKTLVTLPGDGHLAIPLDVTSLDGVKAAFGKILEAWGGIDKVIYMAGIYNPMKLDSLKASEVRDIVETNLTAAFYVAEVTLPSLLGKPGTQIAFCASVAGYRGLPKSQPYAASKAGLINLAESLRAECGGQLDVRLICPGFVKTRLTDMNDFKMPMIMEPQEAAIAIAKGLESGRFEIHFPRRFTLLMKALRLLPNWLYFRIVG